MVNTRVFFGGLVLVVALQRLSELRRSARHTQRLRERGGIEYGAEHYPWMVALHTLFFASLALELWMRRPHFHAALAWPALFLFLASAALRAWSMISLGDRWTTRVLRVPGDPIQRSGPYRWLRHPNYVGVGGELLALPLIHGCWMTSLLFSVSNGVLLRLRIQTEERALRETQAV